MVKGFGRIVLLGCLGILSLWSGWDECQSAQGDDPAPSEMSLPEIGEETDEFYARVDKIISPTELLVTVLDIWQPGDKLQGPRWPEGEARVRPASRVVILEDITAPDDAEQQKEALDFLRKTIEESDHEVICTGSNVVVSGDRCDEAVRITGYVYVKEGFTLNRALVRSGLATSANPVHKAIQEQAKQKRLGIWKGSP